MYDELQLQLEREKEVSESYHKEITSLQLTFASYVEEGGSRTDCSSSSDAIMVRDLKLQLEQKELQLEKLHHEVKSAIQARDAAVCAKNEMMVSHQAETMVSSPSCSPCF